MNADARDREERRSDTISHRGWPRLRLNPVANDHGGHAAWCDVHHEGRHPPHPMSAGSWRLPAVPDDRPTFLAHAMALSALHGTGPWPSGGYPLPDAEPARRRPFLSGAVADGVQTHHGGIQPDQTTTDTAAALLQTLVTRKPATADLDRLHDLLAGQSALSIADCLTTAVHEHNLPTGRVHAIGRWLAEHGTRRHAVAAGLVVIGATGGDRDLDLLLLLGSLEDLTLYAAVALRRSHSDPDRAIFELAKRVDGWGRIHAVERLRGTCDPEIRAWLLRDGFRNAVMNDYLAHLAATTGDLHGALTAPDVDDPLLDGAGDILDALCAVGGPAKDITHYPHGPATIDQYLTLVGQRPPTLDRVASVLRLGRFIASDSRGRITIPASWNHFRAPPLAWGESCAIFSPWVRARLQSSILCDSGLLRRDWPPETLRPRKSLPTAASWMASFAA